MTRGTQRFAVVTSNQPKAFFLGILFVSPVFVVVWSRSIRQLTGALRRWNLFAFLHQFKRFVTTVFLCVGVCHVSRSKVERKFP
jgi:hypothetical protein